MATTFFMLATAPAVGILPASALATSWSQNAITTARCGYLSTVAGSSQTQSTAVVASVTTNTLGLYQFVSDYLAPQTISGTFDIGYAINTTVSSTTIANGVVFLGILTPSGTKFGTSFAIANATASNTITNGAERTVWATGLTLTSQTIADGYRLLLEIGAIAGVTGDSTTAFVGGTTAITANNIATADAQAFITYSGTISFLTYQKQTIFTNPKNNPVIRM